MYESETRVCKCCVGTTTKKHKKQKHKVYILHQKEIFVLHQKGIALSISKDPIDSATMKLHIIHKNLLLKIPFVNKQKIRGHYPTDEIFLLKQIICHSRYRTDLTLHYL